MQERLTDFEKAGASLVAVSPSLPDNSLSMVEKHSLTFPVLSDKENQLARKFGIVYAVDGEMGELYAKFGMDLKKINATEKAELPLAATYVIDSKGVIQYAYLDVDYAKRADPELILQALRSM